jgi:hypothetical protein
LTIELQNRISSTIQLSKQFMFDHWAVLQSGFADIDATWQWDPHVTVTTSLLSPLDVKPLTNGSLTYTFNPLSHLFFFPLTTHTIGTNGSLGWRCLWPAVRRPRCVREGCGRASHNQGTHRRAQLDEKGWSGGIPRAAVLLANKGGVGEATRAHGEGATTEG